MAYKKYIKRGGKTYGPYVYHSKRVDGKVVSEYIGPHRRKINCKKISLVVLGIFVFLMLVFFLRNFEGETTGRAVLSFDMNYSYLEAGVVEGSLNLSLQEKDFIPTTSKIIFENAGNISEFYLKDLISDSEIIEKEIYPTVYFNLIVELEGPAEINETKEVPEDIEKEKPEETETNVTTNETAAETNETMESNETEEEDKGETANETIKETESNEINETTETSESSESEATETVENGEEGIQETTESAETEEEITETETEAKTGEKISEADEGTSEKEAKESEVEKETEKETSEESEKEAEEETSEESESEESSEAPITGETISESENQMLISRIAKIISGFFLSLRTTGYAIGSPAIIPGEVSLGQDFVYNSEGQVIESIAVESGSVRTDSGNLSEEDIKLETEDSKIIVSTNYSEIAEGFSGTDLIISISDLNITLLPGELKIKIVEPDSGKEIFSFLATIGKNITVINETEVVVLPEVIELNDSEKEILIKEFGGNVSVNVSEAVEKNNLLVVKYELEDYKMIRSYDLDLSKEIIESFMERDRIKFLKDIARTLSQEKESGEERDEFLGEWSIS